MPKLLHIVATPREDESRTLKISEAFLNTLQEKHPDWGVEELNLTKEKMPPLTMRRVDGKYMLLQGKDLFGDLKEGWKEIIQQIEHFLSADYYVVSTPMWNFSIPYPLKHYIDVIVQPKFLFRYTESGVEGLAKNKKMVILASRGGEYSSEATRAADFQMPYLKTIFNFVGITDIQSIVAEPMDMGEKMKNERLESAITEAKKLALRF